MIRIVEVGPRDGLQNEAVTVPTRVKRQFIEGLVLAGLRHIEATSFVSPKAVPQLADADELFPTLAPGPDYSALVPNMRGLDRALASGVRHIALFTAASDAFVLRNIGMSVEDSLAQYPSMIARFRSVVPHGPVRAYISTIVECPFSGPVEPGRVAEIASRLAATGVNEISLGETLGVATPTQIRAVARALEGREVPDVAWHFHDTYGTALANVAEVLSDPQYRTFDSSAAGLGGCPFAPGASGNLATEDLVYFLSREGFESGVDLDAVIRASEPVLASLGRPTASRASRAWVAGTSPK